MVAEVISLQSLWIFAAIFHSSLTVALTHRDGHHGPHFRHRAALGKVPTVQPAVPRTASEKGIVDETIDTPSSGINKRTANVDVSITAYESGLISNIFVAISSDAPPQNIGRKTDHPVPRRGIKDSSGPLETNKFYGNFFLGFQNESTWTQPYSVAWAKGKGSWGLSISQTSRSQLIYGPGTPVKWFKGPSGLDSIILSAKQLKNSTVLTTDSLEGFSVNVNLHPAAGSASLIQFPLVQGMGFVTGIYTGGTPMLQSSVFFKSITPVGVVGAAGYSSSTYKYRLALKDGAHWLLYVTPNGDTGTPSFDLVDEANIHGPAGFFGTIQVAKNPAGSRGEEVYDASAGTYARAGAVSASVHGKHGAYTISWSKGGVTSNKLLMFALPHHLDSMDDTTKKALTVLKLDTTTKGKARAVLADSITMVERLATDMGFAPYHPEIGSITSVSDKAAAAIRRASAVELKENIFAQTNFSSMYFNGKGLAKFASIVYATADIGKDATLAAAGLLKLKSAFATFINNKQVYPLVYESAWGGVVSSASYVTGLASDDFGNTYYNDHHFHYGYHVYTAAVIAYLDREWLSQGTNRAWVNMLIRDFANPVTDEFFLFSRMFDWYHGHSFAKGLFHWVDGKDEESSSEDAFAMYAIKMWGFVTGDRNMEARSDLQLAIQARSFQHYFLLANDNKVQPPRFIGNKVSGILWENVVNHTTYFGDNIEYIQGIHMIPLAPPSALTRTSTFVAEEWDTYFSHGRVDKVIGGWRGILYANLALTDPQASYDFFAQKNFSSDWLDGGASRTWYLAFAAGLGGL